MAGPGLDNVQFATAKDVRFRAVLDEGIVIRQRAGEVLVLNQVGVRIFQLIEQNRATSQIADLLVEEFDVERDQLQSDVASFTGELERAGVLERLGSEEAPSAVGGAAESSILKDDECAEGKASAAPIQSEQGEGSEQGDGSVSR